MHPICVLHHIAPKLKLTFGCLGDVPHRVFDHLCLRLATPAATSNSTAWDSDFLFLKHVHDPSCHPTFPWLCFFVDTPNRNTAVWKSERRNWQHNSTRSQSMYPNANDIAWATPAITAIAPNTTGNSSSVKDVADPRGTPCFAFGGITKRTNWHSTHIGCAPPPPHNIVEQSKHTHTI
jgi:hypothetical protein